MGMLSRLAGFLKSKKEKMTILVVGLNNSGKSTIINHFKNPNEQTIISVPTVGFTIEQFQSQGINFAMIDMSGAGRYRSLWEHYFKSCQGLIYVTDSSDLMRLVVAKEELNIILEHPDLINRPIPILLYANKMDCEDSLSSVKIATALNLENIRDKSWHICSSNAISGEGLEEGIQWLIQQIRLSLINSKNKSKRNRSY